MKKCSRCQMMFLPYLDDALSDRDKEKIEEHLKGCINCQRELELFKGIGELLTKKNKARMPQSYWQEFQNKLRHRLFRPHYKPEISIFWKIGNFLKPQTVFAICSILLILIAAGILIREHSLVRFHQNQALQLQARLEELEEKNRVQAAQLVILEKISESPRYQIVVLQKGNPISGMNEPVIFYREAGGTIPINNLKDF